MTTLAMRSLFVSDLHLGTRDAHASQFLELLRHTRCENLYLVGDILDLWQAKRGWYWPQLNNVIVQLLLEKVREGTRVIYIPGNHDGLLRDYAGMNFNGIEVVLEALHETADGRRLLVLHGDLFDAAVRHNSLLAPVGDRAYGLLLGLNRTCHRIRQQLGYGYWSLSAYIKAHLNKALRYIDSFEQAALREVRCRGVDGIICGHIHKANLRQLDGITYANTGDWVEHCSALVEEADGRLRIIHWASEREQLLSAARQTESSIASAA